MSRYLQSTGQAATPFAQHHHKPNVEGSAYFLL